MLRVRKDFLGKETKGIVELIKYGYEGWRIKLVLEGEGLKVENSLLIMNGKIENEGLFVSGKGTFEIKDTLKKLGFRWDSMEKRWYSYKNYIDIVKKVVDYILENQVRLEDLEVEEVEKEVAKVIKEYII